MIISYDNDSLIFDMHIMMKMISRYYHSIITQISIKYQNSILKQITSYQDILINRNTAP